MTTKTKKAPKAKRTAPAKGEGAESGARRARMARLTQTPIKGLRAEYERRTGGQVDGLTKDHLVKHLAELPEEAGAFAEAPKGATEPAPTNGKAPRERDPRIPATGTTITKRYKDEAHEVEVLEHGFRWHDREFGSLTAVAKAITGAPSINGLLFFGLTTRKPADEPPAEPAHAEPEAPKGAKAGRKAKRAGR